jgi:hypothetical protein
MFTERYELQIKIYFKLIFFFEGLNQRRKVFPLRAMKAFKGSGNVSLVAVILNLDPGWRLVISPTVSDQPHAPVAVPLG